MHPNKQVYRSDMGEPAMTFFPTGVQKTLYIYIYHNNKDNNNNSNNNNKKIIIIVIVRH